MHPCHYVFPVLAAGNSSRQQWSSCVCLAIHPPPVTSCTALPCWRCEPETVHGQSTSDVLTSSTCAILRIRDQMFIISRPRKGYVYICTGWNTDRYRVLPAAFTGICSINKKIDMCKTSTTYCYRLVTTTPIHSIHSTRDVLISGVALTGSLGQSKWMGLLY